MGTQERRARQKKALRETILEAARDLFATRGFEAVTMREIAQKIEYSPTAIYLHFKDKDALLHELCVTDFLAFAGSFQRIARVKDPIKRFHQLGLAYVEFAVAHPNDYRIMFMTPYPDIHYEQRSVEFKNDPEKDAYALLKSTVVEIHKAKRFRKQWQDPEMLTQITWAAVHGIASLYIAKSNDPWVNWRPVKKSARVMVDVMIHGLLKEGA